MKKTTAEQNRNKDKKAIANKQQKKVIACVGINVAKSFGPSVVFVYIKCLYSTTKKT